MKNLADEIENPLIYFNTVSKKISSQHRDKILTHVENKVEMLTDLFFTNIYNIYYRDYAQ